MNPDCSLLVWTRNRGTLMNPGCSLMVWTRNRETLKYDGLQLKFGRVLGVQATMNSLIPPFSDSTTQSKCPTERLQRKRLAKSMLSITRSSRASSGSRSSIRSIDPLMSANNAVTVLRSPSSACGSELSTATRMPEEVVPAVAFEGCSASRLREVAHCAQNLASGGF
jgi:hypothetical protein